MKITKLYSDYDEYYDEKLYNTGNDDLDDLLERAFCDGYEYAQREFGIVGGSAIKALAKKPVLPTTPVGASPSPLPFPTNKPIPWWKNPNKPKYIPPVKPNPLRKGL